jgi:hypothetical protein
MKTAGNTVNETDPTSLHSVRRSDELRSPSRNRFRLWNSFSSTRPTRVLVVVVESCLEDYEVLGQDSVDESVLLVDSS